MGRAAMGVLAALLFLATFHTINGKRTGDLAPLLAPSPKAAELVGGCDCAEAAANTSVLFTQDAASATLMLSEPNGDPRAARLVLTGISPSTLYFTDTPRRVAGKLSTLSFTSLFSPRKPGATVNVVPENWAPNAALSGDLNGVQHTVVVTLGKPTYNSATQTLIYERADIIPVDEKTEVAPVTQTLAGYYQQMHRQVDGVPGSILNLKAANLFIDSGSYCGTTSDGSYANAPICPYADDPCKGHYNNEFIGSGLTRIWCPKIVGMGDAP